MRDTSPRASDGATAARVLGVDGARGGWVGILDDGAGIEARWATTLADLVRGCGPVDVVAVDMPIELEVGGRRRADDEARALLGARRASVFAAPALGALDFADDDYAGANAWSKQVTGRGISKQAWFLLPKIREVRALVADLGGASGTTVAETMPELSFRAMHGDVDVAHPKTTWSGLMGRLALLADHGIVLDADPGEAGRAAPDDLADAAALAWSARRIADGTAAHVPSDTSGPTIWW